MDISAQLDNLAGMDEEVIEEEIELTFYECVIGELKDNIFGNRGEYVNNLLKEVSRIDKSIDIPSLKNLKDSCKAVYNGYIL